MKMIKRAAISAFAVTGPISLDEANRTSMLPDGEIYGKEKISICQTFPRYQQGVKYEGI
jgi:hypothetical protein